MLTAWARRLVLGASILLIGCSNTDVLNVDMYHLRTIKVANNVSQDLGNAEKKYLLYEKVSDAERIEQLGHYYTVRWIADPGAGPVEIILKYRQAKTGAKILRKSITRAETSGTTHLNVNGDAYSKNGRILSWMLELKQSGKILATEQSYLWE